MKLLLRNTVCYPEGNIRVLLLTNWEKIAAQKCIWLAQRLPFQWSPWRATRNVLKGTVIIQVYLDHCLVHWASCSPKQWTLSCQWERAAVSCDSPNPGPGYAGSFQSCESQCAVAPLCACVRTGKVGCAAAPQVKRCSVSQQWGRQIAVTMPRLQTCSSVALGCSRTLAAFGELLLGLFC